MPVQPNVLERQLIGRGVIPWPLLDVFLPTFQAAAVNAAAELGVFDALGRDSLSVAELAQRTGSSRAGTEVLLSALAGLGYVEEHDHCFRLTAAARRGVPVAQMRTMAPFLWEMLRLTQETTRAVREAPPRGVASQERIQGGPVGRGFQAAMRWLASGNVEEVARLVKLPASARCLLDVGGSHGLYTVALCRKYPELAGTILDWPVGIEAARETMEAHPDVAARIDFVERDFEREELPGGYDVAFLGNIVHGLTPEGNQQLFGKLASAMAPAATIVILDQLAGATGSAFARTVAGLIGLNLFLVAGGRAYRFADLAQWLAAAGFPSVTRTPLRRAPGLSVVVARR